MADACVLRELFAAPALQHTAVVWTSNRAPTAVYSGGLNHSRIAPFVAALHRHHQVVNLDAHDLPAVGEADQNKDLVRAPSFCTRLCARDEALDLMLTYTGHDAGGVRCIVICGRRYRET